MTLYKKAKRLINAHGIFPKKCLGQNFMVESHFLELMVSYSALAKSDVVLEVGAGLGFLTRFLAQQAGRVVAVEVDGRLMKILRNEVADFDNIELIEGDIIKTSVRTFNKVVSNPPFSISSPLLFWLLDRSFDTAVLTFQKEFARRLDAPIGSKDYSRLTVSTYYRAEVELLDNVPREAFHPRPDVDAVIVRLKPRGEPPFKVRNPKIFDEILRAVFTQRNRKIRKAALPFLHRYGLKEADALKRADLLPFRDKRVRELAPEDFGALANELSN